MINAIFFAGVGSQLFATAAYSLGIGKSGYWVREYKDHVRNYYWQTFRLGSEFTANAVPIVVEGSLVGQITGMTVALTTELLTDVTGKMNAVVSNIQLLNYLKI